ncbi:MAG: RdgB/HAM1 family non-canonical purine NTP pyrophosphatase [Bacteroidota bacterium]|nr:RdgB/HAM1 family non-canonical purine NTP pyrophosphatase [Bacteroidota bacterium]
MKQLIFASNNRHKADEIRALLNNRFDIITLKEAGIEIDIPEPHETLAKNASEKSSVIFQLTGKDCFSEDSGLEVEGLNGAPGVKSARYAGDTSDATQNNALLLHNMKNISNRNAVFKTVISLIIDGNEYLFEGTCSGKIALTPSGTGGFGYDPLFIPDGYDQTFAILGLDVKSAISHRKKAVDQMNAFLKTIA